MNHEENQFATTSMDLSVLVRDRRWIGVGIVSGALLTSCIDSEEALYADSVETVDTTSSPDTGDADAESSGESMDAVEDEPELPLSAERAGLSPFVPYEVIVKFRSSASARSRADFMADTRFEDITADTGLVRFEADASVRRSARNAIAATWARVDELRAREDVEFAHPNWLVKLSLVPNDKHYSKQWHYPQINLRRLGTLPPAPRLCA